MPDIFAGDTAPVATAVADDSTSILEQFKLKAVEVTKSFLIDMWLARITEERVMPILHKVIDAAREQYADSIQRGDGIYAAGYCVGARFILLLAKKTKVAEGDAESGGLKSGPFIKAGALAHATSVTPDDFKDLSVPLSLVCLENDPLFTDEVRIAGEDTMSDANLEHEVQVYPGVPHGKPSLPQSVLLDRNSLYQGLPLSVPIRMPLSGTPRLQRMSRCSSGFSHIKESDGFLCFDEHKRGVVSNRLLFFSR